MFGKYSCNDKGLSLPRKVDNDSGAFSMFMAERSRVGDRPPRKSDRRW